MTQDILIESNYIYDNGIVGRYYEHNTYTAAIGITYQYNVMGALRAGAGAITSRIDPQALWSGITG